MIVVLDASAAIEIALNKQNGDNFRNILKSSDLVIAPDTFPSEITNVFWKYANFSNLAADKCSNGIDYCIDLIDDFIETRGMCREVLSESIIQRHPVYDLFYLVVARRHNAAILSSDKKMLKLAAELKINVICES